MNLARIKCLSQLVCAMCKVQTVNFSKLASAFDNRTPKESSFRRIQRFMSQTVLNLDIVAKSGNETPAREGSIRVVDGQNQLEVR